MAEKPIRMQMKRQSTAVSSAMGLGENRDENGTENGWKKGAGLQRPKAAAAGIWVEPILIAVQRASELQKAQEVKI